jgi:hypothetical protein
LQTAKLRREFITKATLALETLVQKTVTQETAVIKRNKLNKTRMAHLNQKARMVQEMPAEL